MLGCVSICRLLVARDPQFHLFFQRLTNKAQSREGFSHWCSENQQILPRRGRLISPCCSLNFVSYFRRLLVVVGSWVSLRQPRVPFFPPVCTPQAEATDICLTGADKFTSITITRTAVPQKTMGGSVEPRLKDFDRSWFLIGHRRCAEVFVSPCTRHRMAGSRGFTSNPGVTAVMLLPDVTLS